MVRSLAAVFLFVLTLPTVAFAQYSSVTLAWDPTSEPGVTSYVIEYGPSSGNYPQSASVGLSTQFQVQGLTLGSTYYFTVRAQIGNVMSARSNEVIFTATGANTIDCSISFSDRLAGFGASGGGGTFALATGKPCAWTVADNVEWLSIDPATTTGIGSTTITYTVDVNPSKEPRTAIIYSGNRSVIVKQSGRKRGDFNGDGLNDLIWQNRSTGEISLWRMNGVDLVGGNYFLPGNVGDTNWKIMGSLDADRDGQSDLLFQHDDGRVAIWRMKGNARVEGLLVNESVTSDPRWRIVGTGDLDQDNFDDIIWQHQDGRVSVWYMNGLQMREKADLATVSDPRWRVTGVDDFNGDGKVDLLWRHTAWGQLLVWHMDNKQYLGAGMNLIMANGEWDIVSTGDYNDDGKADLIWRNSRSGELAAWFMDGVNIIGSRPLNPAQISDMNWRIAGPR
jgi:hypothetical protein